MSSGSEAQLRIENSSAFEMKEKLEETNQEMTKATKVSKKTLQMAEVVEPKSCLMDSSIQGLRNALMKCEKAICI